MQFIKRFPFPLRFTVPSMLMLMGTILGAWSYQQQVSQSLQKAEEHLAWQTQYLGLRSTSGSSDMNIDITKTLK
jgi:hypothetical protein